MENLTAKLKPIDKDSEAIILLHGLARTSRSMNKAAKLLAAYGYKIINVDYPSRSADISILAQKYIAQALKQCDVEGVKKIHFLTHSMGGILLRHYLASQSIEKLGRVVMLAPPNQGSEVVDKLGGWRLFYYLSGPAGLQLGTGNSSVPNQLGPVNFQVGIIAGNKIVDPLLSRLIPGVNDGKVSVNRAQVEGMQDFIVMPYSHPFIMRSEAVIEQALHFIQQGCFAR
ncbi:MAG TPA: alpha/beta fold hydrolase [Methylobacter sp.]|jgi:pimeloyl-ACP methyl ester carboxylesterase